MYGCLQGRTQCLLLFCSGLILFPFDKIQKTYVNYVNTIAFLIASVLFSIIKGP